MDKKDLFLYPDGIYIKEQESGFSYLKKVYSVKLDTQEELIPFIEKGRPSDKFEFYLDKKEYANKHIVPWSILKNMIDIAHMSFAYRGGNQGILYLFLIQEINETGNDKFKLLVPSQNIQDYTSQHILPIDRLFKPQLEQYLDSHENSYLVGQFIFINNSLDGLAKNANVALYDQIPQHVYIFNGFDDDFNFRDKFAAFKTVPETFQNGLSSGQTISHKMPPKEAIKYLQLPTKEEKINTDKVFYGFNDSIEHQYFSNTIKYQTLPLDENIDLLGCTLNQYFEKITQNNFDTQPTQVSQKLKVQQTQQVQSQQTNVNNNSQQNNGQQAQQVNVNQNLQQNGGQQTQVQPQQSVVNNNSQQNSQQVQQTQNLFNNENNSVQFNSKPTDNDDMLDDIDDIDETLTDDIVIDDNAFAKEQPVKDEPKSEVKTRQTGKLLNTSAEDKVPIYIPPKNAQAEMDAKDVRKNYIENNLAQQKEQASTKLSDLMEEL